MRKYNGSQARLHRAGAAVQNGARYLHRGGFCISVFRRPVYTHADTKSLFKRR